MKSLIREPLLHFLLLGAVIFGAYALVSDYSSGGDQQLQQIVVSEGQIDALITGFEKVWQRLPSQAELEGLVQSHIREEIMYREALAMGLDRNDSIIRRRLQQKLEFITDDIASIAQAEDADLEAFLAANPDRFRQESRFSFRQIYINTSDRGASALTDAQDLLQRLQNESDDVESLANAGDRLLMIQPYFENAYEREIRRDLGTGFLEELKLLPAQSWQGPVESGYGLHLVFIDTKEEGRVPLLADIRPAVETEWNLQQRTKANEAFYTALRQGYQVTIQTGDEIDTDTEELIALATTTSSEEDE